MKSKKVALAVTLLISIQLFLSAQAQVQTTLPNPNLTTFPPRWWFFLEESRIDSRVSALSREYHPESFAITHVNILPAHASVDEIAALLERAGRSDQAKAFRSLAIR